MTSTKISILHITPHLGGGVGRVLLNYLSRVADDVIFQHQVVCLDYANENAIQIAKEINLPLLDNISKDISKLVKIIKDVDIILIHWWNHPLLFDFLVCTEIPPSRIIFWSHISGFDPPYVFTKKALTYPDLFVFTTPISYETKEVQSLSEKEKESLKVVWSTGGIDHVKNVELQSHKEFNIGYIGTVDYCKLHPNFLTMCNQIKIPNSQFIVCGGSNEKEIMEQSKQLGIAHKFNFTGLIPDIKPYLSIFDVFGYPLAPYHYGTCDQVLAEAMAVGIVPVVLDNRMERFMVQDDETGIVAKNELEYIHAVEKLYYDEKLKERLSNQAIEYAVKTFSLENMIKSWQIIFNEVLAFSKLPRKWDIRINHSDISPKDIFLESIGEEYGIFFINDINDNSNKNKEQFFQQLNKPFWKSKTRGTVLHYQYFFQKDEYLNKWAKIINSI